MRGHAENQREVTTAFETGEGFALQLDKADPLAPFRDMFFIPGAGSGEPNLYLAGNSLGLEPKGVREAVEQELLDWENLGVRGHFEGTHPWYAYHEAFAQPLSQIVGALPEEVVLMNSLTVNLHLMLVSFYAPTRKRHKILIEANAFPSDRYAVESQIRFHGFDPETSLLVARPENGKMWIGTEAIENLLREHGEVIAVVLLGGVNYYSGEAFDMERITRAAQAGGAVVGFDLAHAAGNLVLRLHDWNVDFAVWCNYKYLNSGPGCVGGCFVHARHADNPAIPRFAGWWGNDPATRFNMPDRFAPQPGAAGWQISNAPVLSMAPCRVSFDIFTQAGMDALRKKSVQLTGYLEFLLDQIPTQTFRVLTPRDPKRRGCQLSIQVKEKGETLSALLERERIVCDFRKPDVIRVAPVPLYNSFHEVWRFCRTFARVAGQL